MLRLAHRILQQKGTPLFSDWEQLGEISKLHFKRTRDQLPHAHIICADNVFEFQNNSAKEWWDFHNDFPAPVPVFDLMFIEWNTHGTRSFSQLGWHFISTRFKPGDNADSIPALFNSPEVEKTKASLEFQDVLTIGSLFGTTSPGLPLFTGNLCLFVLNKKGQMKADPSFVAIAPPSDQEVIRETAYDAFITGVLTLSFMHCKNVVRTDATETEGPPAKWLRRMKQPEIRYHRLEINPMKEVLRREGGSETNGLKKALHICRGHFATYTEERPLFGSFAGTVFREAHVRGSEKEGIVVKDYSVKPPQ